MLLSHVHCRQKTNLEKSEKGRPHVRIGFETPDTEDVEWRHCGHDEGGGGGHEPNGGEGVI